jgi:hypothetical protein
MPRRFGKQHITLVIAKDSKSGDKRHSPRILRFCLLRQPPFKGNARRPIRQTFFSLLKDVLELNQGEFLNLSAGE